MAVLGQTKSIDKMLEGPKTVRTGRWKMVGVLRQVKLIDKKVISVLRHDKWSSKSNEHLKTRGIFLQNVIGAL